MSITLINGTKAPKIDIESLEKSFGKELPRDYIEFLQLHDGSEPEPNVVSLGEEDDLAVNHFISASEVTQRARDLEVFPEFLPFARDSFGNYFLLNLGENGSVYFWDHEMDDGPTKLCNSFTEFIVALEPDPDVDSDSTADESEGPEVGWKHPDFDTMFAEYLIPKKKTDA